MSRTPVRLDQPTTAAARAVPAFVRAVAARVNAKAKKPRLI
jgi:hypothetical protein